MERRQYGHQVTVTAPTKLEIDIECNIVLDNGYTIAGIKQNIENAIKDYLKTVQTNWFTQDTVTIYISRIIASIVGVEGVVSASNLTLNEQTTDLTIDPNSTGNPYPILSEVTLNAN